MPIITLRDVGKYGVGKDTRPHTLPPGAWSRSQNIRFRDRLAGNIGGHERIFSVPRITPLWLLYAKTPASSHFIYPGLTKIYQWDGLSHKNITRQTAGVDVDYAASEVIGWNGGMLNGIAILNNGVDLPQSWNPYTPAARAVNLANWPTTDRARVIRPHKAFLIALNLTKSGTEFPYLVKWSDAADPGFVPGSWDETDPTTLAGENPLAEGGDFIVDGLDLRDTFIIYKESSVWLMQFVGGQFVFRFQKLFDDFGLLSQECVREFKSRHFVVSNDDIIIHDGNQWESIGKEKVRRNLFNNINPEQISKVFVQADYKNTEMWICYPESGVTYCNRALIWNWEEGTFTERDIPGLVHMAYGQVSLEESETWDSFSGEWDAASTIWDSGLGTRTEEQLIMAAVQADSPTEYGTRTNLLRKSEAYDDAIWTKTDTTITADATAAPDALSSADLLTEGVAGTARTYQDIAIAAAATITNSLYLKRSNHDWVQVASSNTAVTSGIRLWVNLTTGAIGTAEAFGTGTYTSSAIEDVGDGWFRVNLTGSIDGVSTTARLFTQSADADASATRVNNAARYQWGAQGEVGTLTPYIPNDSATLSASHLGAPAFFLANAGFQFDGEDPDCVLERTGLAYVGQSLDGQPIVDLGKIKLIKGVYPKIDVAGSADFEVYVGSQMLVDGPITWHGPFSYDPTAQFKIDCMVAARLVGVRFLSNTNMPWVLEEYGLETEIVGEF